MIAKRQTRRGRLSLLLLAAVVVFVLVSLTLYRIVNDAVRTEIAGQTQASASTAAVAVANAIREDTRLAAAISGEGGSAAIVQHTAGRADTYAVQYANINIQRANPQVTGLYYYDNAGTFVTSQTVNSSHRPPARLSISCDSTFTYCVDGNQPTSGFLGAPGAMAQLARQLAHTTNAVVTLAFGRGLGSFGALFIAQPIRQQTGSGNAGLLVLQVDAASVFSPYLADVQHRNLILYGTIVIGRDMPLYQQRGLLPVDGMRTSISRSIAGGLTPTTVGTMSENAVGQVSLGGADVVGSVAAVGVSGMQVVSYTNANALSSAESSLILAAVPLVLLLILCVVGPVYYQSMKARQDERRQARDIQARADTLTRDIMVVARALDTARGSTSRGQESVSEVDRLTQSLSGLLRQYGEVARGIAQASRSLERQAGQARQEVAEATDLLGASVPALAGALSVTLQTARNMVAAEAESRALQSSGREISQAAAAGGESAARESALLLDLKQGLVDLSHELDRLKEQSNRLTAVVGSAKQLADGLQSQATYLDSTEVLKGADSLEATSASIGRLARQARGALAEIEAAGRGFTSAVGNMGGAVERSWDRYRDVVSQQTSVERVIESVTTGVESHMERISTLSTYVEREVAVSQEVANVLSVQLERAEKAVALASAALAKAAEMQALANSLSESAAGLDAREFGLGGERSINGSTR